MAHVAATPNNGIPAQGDALTAVIMQNAEAEKAEAGGNIPVAQKAEPTPVEENEDKENADTKNKAPGSGAGARKTAPGSRAEGATPPGFLQQLGRGIKQARDRTPKPDGNKDHDGERIRLRLELKDSTDELYSENYAPTWLWTLVPVPILMLPLMKYHVTLTSCELKFGFTSSLTSATIPMDEILHVKKVFLTPAMFFGYGARHNGSHWGYIGSGKPQAGIRIVVKNQNKTSWLKTLGYIKPDGPPQMIFFTCENVPKFMANFEKVEDAQVVDSL